MEKDYTLEEFSYILKSQSHQSDSHSDRKDFNLTSDLITQASSVPKFENSAASSRCEASELHEILDVRSKEEQGGTR